MTLLDTIAQAATFLDYTHLSDDDSVAQYNIDLEWDNIHDAELGYEACWQAYLDLTEVNGLDDDQILSLNHNYQLEG